MIRQKIVFFLTLLLSLKSSFSSSPKIKEPSLLLISCSLNPQSKGAVIASYLREFLNFKGYKVEFVDLRDYTLPIANGHDQSAYENADVKYLYDKILHAQGIILVAPIYNYGVGATAKNLVELTGHPYKDLLTHKSWENKVIGFIGMSGSPRSAMAPLSFLNGMMLDYNALIIPSFVVASGEDFNNNNQLSQEIRTRIEKLSLDVVKISKVLFIQN